MGINPPHGMGSDAHDTAPVKRGGISGRQFRMAFKKLLMTINSEKQVTGEREELLVAVSCFICGIRGRGPRGYFSKSLCPISVGPAHDDQRE